MNGYQALELLANKRTDEIVVTTMSTALEWPHYSSRPELDLPLFNCMGKASSLGLGVAIGAPQRQVWVLDGDGSLLMNLGALVTVANAAPSNYLHVVFQNGTYDSSGGQPVPGGQAVKIASLALGAGYRAAYEYESKADFGAAFDEIRAALGPVLVALKVDPLWAKHGVTGRMTRQAISELPALLASQPR